MITTHGPEHDRAIARFESYAAQDPANSQIWTTLGDLYHTGGRLDDASNAYGRAIALAPEDRVVRGRAASVLLSRNAFAEAEQAFGALIAEGEDDGALHHNLGVALFHQDKHAEAIESLHRAAMSDVGPLPHNLALQAHAYHHLGDMQKAAALGRAWVERESTTTSHGYLALAEMDNGETAAAYARAAAVLEQDPDNVDASIVSGTDLLERQEMERAHALFRQVLGRQPNNGRAWMCMGLIHAYRQEFDRAIEALERALALMPTNGGARIALGWTHILNRDVEKAEAVFEEAVRVNRNFAESHGGLATVFAMTGRSEEARDAVRRANGLQRGSFGGSFAHAILLDQQGRRDLAVRLAEKVLTRELRPGSPTLFESLQALARREAARGMAPPVLPSSN